MERIKESLENCVNPSITWNLESDKAQGLPGLIKYERARKKQKKNDEPTPISPPEVIVEILSWLPLKYLLKVQLVCKEWQAVIHDHYFREKDKGRSSVVYYCYNYMRNNTSLVLKPGSFSYNHGCDGLLLVTVIFSRKYVIWNPAIRRVRELPNPHDKSYGFAFCYVPATRNYRIVSIYKDKESGRAGCEVLTPGHSMSWRRLTFPDIVNANENMEKEKISVVSAGVAVHFVLVTKIGRGAVADIATLDLETECFTVNRLPQGLFSDMKTVWELDWDGKLAFVDIVGHNLQLMELEDYKKQRWYENKKIIPSPFLKDNGVEGNVLPLFNRQGDLWFWLKNERIFVYTMKTGQFREISDSKPRGTISLKSKLYTYKPSLVAFEGMQPETDLAKFPHRLRLD